MAGAHNVRLVGWAIRQTKDPSVPCHRVVKVGRAICVNNPEYTIKQKFRLEAEGVKFKNKQQVDLEKYLWNEKNKI